MTIPSTRLLVSLDDTDNLESRGTGHRARGFGRMLANDCLAKVHGISRHQLFVHPDIPYTSHNSSLCLDLEWHGGALEELQDIARAFLAEYSAEGSDAGFCIARFDEVSDDVTAFGRDAKVKVLTQAQARTLASDEGIILEGVTGTEGGVIGALAAVGLRKTGHDGRFVWVEGVRELAGVITLEKLLAKTGIDRVHASCGADVGGSARISVDPWPRPVLLDHKAVLLIEKTEDTNADCEWKLVPREFTKQY